MHLVGGAGFIFLAESQLSKQLSWLKLGFECSLADGAELVLMAASLLEKSWF